MLTGEESKKIEAAWAEVEAHKPHVTRCREALLDARKGREAAESAIHEAREAFISGGQPRTSKAALEAIAKPRARAEETELICAAYEHDLEQAELELERRERAARALEIELLRPNLGSALLVKEFEAVITRIRGMRKELRLLGANIDGAAVARNRISKRLAELGADGVVSWDTGSIIAALGRECFELADRGSELLVASATPPPTSWSDEQIQQFERELIWESQRASRETAQLREAEQRRDAAVKAARKAEEAAKEEEQAKARAKAAAELAERERAVRLGFST
jgi:hypothetical protein